MKHCRRVIISIFIMAAMFAMFIPLSYADMDSSTFGNWMTVAATASNIVEQSTLPLTAPIDDFLCDPFNIQEGVYTAINYTFPRVNLQTPSMALDAYLQRSSIQVRGDTITIDGIDYRDIWVSNEAAQAFRTNVFDIQTAFNIASNSNGKFVSGYGTLDGLPVFETSSGLQTQHYFTDSPEVVGTSSGYRYYYRLENGGRAVRAFMSNPGSAFYHNVQYSTLTYSLPSFGMYIKGTSVVTAYGAAETWPSYENSVTNARPTDQVPIVHEPFDFTWVSQNIPSETLSTDDGLHLLVPNNPDQFSDPAVQQNIRDFNDNINNNFTVDTPISLDDDDNYNRFDNLFNDISDNLPVARPNFGPYDQYSPTPTPPPAPTPVPVPIPTAAPVDPPYDKIGTTPWAALEDWLLSIRLALNNIVIYLANILDAIRDLPNQFSSIFDPEEGSFATWLKTLLTGIRGVLDNILHFLDNLANIIENGSAIFFKSLVDVLQDAFQPVLDTFKGLTSIWRYVVGWFGSISGPFYWAFNALGSAGGYMLSPFYAVAAAAIVIAIYRRLGR